MPRKTNIQTNIENPLASDKISAGVGSALFGNKIRPDNFDSYIGQETVKKAVQVSIRSAKARGTQLEHMLFYGPPGLGKTSMACLIANACGGDFVYVSAPNIERARDISSILLSLSPNSVLFIDEIHRMDKSAEEILYSAMEDYLISITIGTGEQTKVRKLHLPPFTLIGATTRAGLVSPPLMDRFLLQCKMEYYSAEELAKIAINTARKLEIELDSAAAYKLGTVSRGTPRIVNKYLKLSRDYAYSELSGFVNDKAVEGAMQLNGISRDGLTKQDKEILRVLYEYGKPVGLTTLSHILGEDAQTVEEVYEPYLMSCQYICVTARGRELTEKGKQYFASNI